MIHLARLVKICFLYLLMKRQKTNEILTRRNTSKLCWLVIHQNQNIKSLVVHSIKTYQA